MTTISVNEGHGGDDKSQSSLSTGESVVYVTQVNWMQDYELSVFKI